MFMKIILDFDQFPLDGLSTIRTLKKIYYNNLYTTALKLANTSTFVDITIDCGGNFRHTFANIYNVRH